MIRALFHKRNKVEKPATNREFNRLYASLLKNICPRLVTTERVGKKKERIYGVDKDMIRESAELDLLKNRNGQRTTSRRLRNWELRFLREKRNPMGHCFWRRRRTICRRWTGASRFTATSPTMTTGSTTSTTDSETTRCFHQIYERP